MASSAVGAARRFSGAAAPLAVHDSTSAGISAVFTPEVQFWRGPIAHWAAEAGLDSNLVAVVMQIESCGDPFARSRSGAMGLFQVMPFHFAATDDPYSPDPNATRGLAYLKRSMTSANQDVRLGLAGYNGGLGVISQPEWLWPAETQRYVYWGSRIYQDAAAGVSASERLNEWLAAGGQALCTTAGQRLHLASDSG